MTSSTLERRFDDGLTLRVRALADGIFHLQAGGYDGYSQTLLDRYGFIENLPDEANVAIADFQLQCGGFSFELTEKAGFRLRRGEEELLASLPDTRVATFPTVHGNRGWQLDLPLQDDEKLVGFGDQIRTRFLLNGQKDELWIHYPTKHVPVPFFMSSRGYGIFFNTTRRLRFDVGATDATRARFTVERDFLDAYLFTGNSYQELIEKYTRLTGRPQLPPQKSFGLWLLFHSRATGHEVLSIAKTLRDAQIPVDNLSLEPAWMQQEYDFTTDKEWSAEKFRGTGHESSYRAGPDHMIHALKRQGFSLGLWLCSRWDFTWEEERRLQNNREEETANNPTLEGIELSHLDENTGHGPWYMDENTNRAEAWFEHLKKFVSDGVRFFKVDPAALINEFPDRLYGNGRHDDEMHNIAFMLCSKQMMLDYEAFTNQRAFGISIAGWAGFQRFPGTWAGDTGGGAQSLTGILQDALVGHPFATCDMNTKSITGIHMGFFLPWSLINSWSYFHYPGFQGDEIDSIYRDYSQLRMQLLPYLYSLAWRATQSAVAMARPMFLLHPETPRAYELLTQFYLGDGLLVTSYQDTVTLPEGRWFNWWDGSILEGDWSEQQPHVPANRGGHLLVREGALIPLGPVQQYVGQKPLEEVRWIVFPGPQSTSFTLYSDDGDSLGHRSGAYASCTLFYTPTEDGFELSWSEIDGGEPERIAQLQHRFEILGEEISLHVEAGGQEVTIGRGETRPSWITNAVPAGTRLLIKRNV
jgi:alpha-glucosidase (family GH31 glycosyl hydrolase)